MAIAVAYDGSQAAKKVLKYAIREAALRKTTLLLVYALAPERVIKDKDPVVRSFSVADLAKHYKQAITQSVQSILQEGEREVAKAGLKWEARVLNIGKGVGPDLVKFFEEEMDHIDMVAVGIYKTSATGKFLLGSTARYVVFNAPCPVLTVSPVAD